VLCARKPALEVWQSGPVECSFCIQSEVCRGQSAIIERLNSYKLPLGLARICSVNQSQTGPFKVLPVIFMAGDQWAGFKT